MSRHTSRRSAARRGSSSVELALLIPFITALVVGSIDLGRGVWTKHSLEHVAGEAVRIAAVNGAQSNAPATQESLTQWVRGKLPQLNPEELTVVASWAPNNRPGSDVSVSLIYNFDPLIPFMPIEAFALTANATSVIAY